MRTIYRILAVNPGSTSTKVAVYDNEKCIFETVVRHTKEEVYRYENIIDQYDFRRRVILELLDGNEINIQKLSAVVGRGGLMKPIQSGTYQVNERMLADLRSSAYGQHASSLGGIIAYEIASGLNIPSFIVDPVVVDEMDPHAKITGMPEIERKSLFHALNQKAVARRAADQLGRPYGDLNLIVAHMGGGISVGAHRRARVVDVNNALDGEGPFSPERTGGLPVGDVIRMCFSGRYTEREMMRKIVGQGGLMAYLGTNDGRVVESMIQLGSEEAQNIYYAMAYQVSKEIGAMAAALKGRVDAVVLTGGLAYDERFTGWIEEHIGTIAPVLKYGGEDEMIALAEGALRVLRGQEAAKEYQ